MQVFMDSSYFFALLVEGDQWHKQAVKASTSYKSAVTSSLVLNETISLLQTKGMFSAALAFLRGVRNTPEVRIVYLDPLLQSEAWDLFARWVGSGANAVDCASFAVMRSLSIKKAFTFDQHFRTAGFEILR